MLKVYLPGMQGLAWEGVDNLLQGGVAWEPQQSRTVQRIADYGVPDMRQMYAELVRAAGFERETQETYRPPGF
jgi:hypothetical protein